MGKRAWNSGFSSGMGKRCFTHRHVIHFSRCSDLKFPSLFYELPSGPGTAVSPPGWGRGPGTAASPQEWARGRWRKREVRSTKNMAVLCHQIRCNIYSTYMSSQNEHWK